MAHVVRQHRLLPCLASASALVHLELDGHDGCLVFDVPAIPSLRQLVLKVGGGPPTCPSPCVPISPYFTPNLNPHPNPKPDPDPNLNPTPYHYG